MVRDPAFGGDVFSKPGFLEVVKQIEDRHFPRTRDFYNEDIRSACSIVVMGLDSTAARIKAKCNFSPLEMEDPKNVKLEQQFKKMRGEEMSAHRAKREQQSESEKQFIRLEVAAIEQKHGDAAFMKNELEFALYHYQMVRYLNPNDVTNLAKVAHIGYALKHYDYCVRICIEALKIAHSTKFELMEELSTLLKNSLAKLKVEESEVGGNRTETDCELDQIWADFTRPQQ